MICYNNHRLFQIQIGIFKEKEMKLFDNYDAVMFPEEKLIFITHNGYIYYT